ncbi:hypothetical protein Ahy_A02g006252 [Arachis hypogaea]|uniref:LRR receptor-like serine/threonine-protein kinase n=1 Tax=Arachis hypogaea TaxID=3818 RepID=A0A445E973_ARAHY|nr:hypothetical protein Ahy_A02g006252 [Arachis hypogaea]
MLSFLQNLINLRILYIFHNMLSRVILSKLFQSTNLTSLHLSNNQLDGNIPLEIGMLDSLCNVNLSNNKLEGLIPFSMLKRGTSVFHYVIFPPNASSSFNNSERHALIQSEIDGYALYINPYNESKLLRLENLNLTSFSNLVHLNLYEMGLMGSIHKEIGTLAKLSYLNLFYNNFYNKLPLTFSNLTQLVILDVALNSLSVILPTFDKLENLNFFALILNQTKGFIPTDLENLAHFESLYLFQFNLLNEFDFSHVGVYSSNLNMLEKLYLKNNSFTSTISSALSQLKNLRYLIFNSNQIEGFILLQIENLNQLILLSLLNNLVQFYYLGTIKEFDISQSYVKSN